MTQGTEAPQQVKTFEWWMMSNFAMGAGYSAFISLLIPPFVKEVSGDASAAAAGEQSKHKLLMAMQADAALVL